MKTSVYTAVSLDGYLARSNGDIDWLDKIKRPAGEDYGYNQFVQNIDAVVIGRKTYEKVLTFSEWPYNKPVFILSGRLKQLSEKLHGKAEIISMKPAEICAYLSERNYKNIYVDGGITITNFLNDNLIDELIITRLPVLLGSGISLFGNFRQDIWLRHKWTKSFSNGFVQSCYGA